MKFHAFDVRATESRPAVLSKFKHQSQRARAHTHRMMREAGDSSARKE